MAPVSGTPCVGSPQGGRRRGRRGSRTKEERARNNVDWLGRERERASKNRIQRKVAEYISAGLGGGGH